ncbi:macrolide family glycosyltransferase [Streptomyces kanamyceticus]|uniref:Glycosyltransferase n=1 Tax=Streptomyces kanamyceticus TaxID=1967 RepID=A0A5J6GKT5_STRKN|nr:macrolide family glycosyltransferase [Streptomyces kanamyceticus]QEU94711.1 glycosyltransferase [Streptomyces kanamyceticus]
MAHIGFFNVPGFGHVNVTQGLVAELVARGHRVSYAVPAAYGAEIERAGARLLPYDTTLSDPRAMLAATADPDRLTTVDYVHNLRGLTRETRAIVPRLLDAFRADPPDLMLYDGVLGWAGRVVADALGVPAIRCVPTLAVNEHWSLASAGYAAFDPADPELAAVFREMGTLFEELDAVGAAQDFFGGGNGPRTTTLVFVPRALQPAGDTFDASHHFVGPCAAPRTLDGDWTPPGDGRPVVLVSLGTVQRGRPGFFRACVEALRDTDWHVVMAVGEQDPAGLGPLPAHIEAHAHLPQQAVLRHADAFVTHAGMGSVLEALSSAVPMVTVPQMGEQRANADRLAELGIGVPLHRDALEPAVLRDAVARLLGDPVAQERARAMRGQIRAAGGPVRAADLVERHLPVAHTAPGRTETEGAS